jgi:hypothetical protein
VQRFALWVGHLVHARPWVRVVLGLVLVAYGAVEVIVGAGTGRVAVFGVLVVLGAATAAKRRRLHERDGASALTTGERQSGPEGDQRDPAAGAEPLEPPR